MATRADKLEEALNDAIAFLAAWPPHPATAAKIRELEEAKRSAPPAEPAYPQGRALVGTPSYAPSGVPVLLAEVIDDTLYLWSGLDITEAWELHKRLVAVPGITVPMRQLGPDEPHTTLEQALRRRAEGFSREMRTPSRKAQLDELNTLREQLAQQVDELRHALREATRLTLAMAALEGGDAAVDHAFFSAMRRCLEETAERLAEREDDESVRDTVAWLSGQLNQALAAPSKRWHLERVVRRQAPQPRSSADGEL